MSFDAEAASPSLLDFSSCFVHLLLIAYLLLLNSTHLIGGLRNASLNVDFLFLDEVLLHLFTLHLDFFLLFKQTDVLFFVLVVIVQDQMNAALSHGLYLWSVSCSWSVSLPRTALPLLIRLNGGVFFVLSLFLVLGKGHRTHISIFCCQCCSGLACVCFKHC